MLTQDGMKQVADLCGRGDAHHRAKVSDDGTALRTFHGENLPTLARKVDAEQSYSIRAPSGKRARLDNDSGLLERERNDEFAAAVFAGAFGPDDAAVHFGDFAGERQTNSQAAFIASAACTRLNE